MDVVSAALRNIKKNVEPPILKKLGWVMLGGVLYPILPTLIESLVKKDIMTGWTGVLTGALGGAAIGAMADKPEISAGCVGAAITHIMYVKANDSIQEFLQRPIFRFDKDSQLFDQLPPGMQVVTTPDGSKIIADVNQQPLSDNVQAPPYALQTGLNDNQAEVPAAVVTMSDNQNIPSQQPPKPIGTAVVTMSDNQAEPPYVPMADHFAPQYGYGYAN